MIKALCGRHIFHRFCQFTVSCDFSQNYAFATLFLALFCSSGQMGRNLDVSENLKGICGQGLGHFCLRIFYRFCLFTVLCDFCLNYAFAHCFLLCFAQVGRWGWMRYGRNVKGICGLGLCHFLYTKILKDEKLELAKE